MKNGLVHEYDSPRINGYDTSKSYLLDSKLNYRKFSFTSIKSRLRVNFISVIFDVDKTQKILVEI
jgi:hypothetical protein